MASIDRFEAFRGASNFHEQLNRVFDDVLRRGGEESNLTTWAPAVDIYETERKSE